MDSRFLAHNAHLENAQRYEEYDPTLRKLRTLPLMYDQPLVDELPSNTPGVYILGGARQVGKTTLLKQWIAGLLKKHVKAQRISFFSGELIDDHHSLVRLVSEFVAQCPAEGLNYLVIDEITYIRSWDRAIKYLADTGTLEWTVLILTGSDLTLIRDARVRFPGRRGSASKVNFHLHPLAFHETCILKGILTAQEFEILTACQLDRITDISPAGWERIDRAVEDYLLHGGFLTAMNDHASQGSISPSTLATYSDWIRGDAVKRGKNETFLREILAAMLSTLGSQVTWNALSHKLSIDHPQTVAEYFHLLESMDAIFIQPAIIEHKLTGAPKKARKICPCDPFIVHAVNTWLSPDVPTYQNDLTSERTRRDASRKAVPANTQSVRPDQVPVLVETCVAAHAHRHFPTYYIKAKGEVDVAFVRNGRFWPIEVKWTSQIRAKDIRQIQTYDNGVIAARTHTTSCFNNVKIIPLAFVLSALGKANWPI
jgi:predicted AAA+ superfamily ATPase